MPGSHDDFFDFNHDGKLDALEWSAKMEFMDEVSADRSEYYEKMAKASRRQKTGTVRPARRPIKYGRPGERKKRASAESAQRENSDSAGLGSGRKEKTEIDPSIWVAMIMIVVLIGFLLGCQIFSTF